MSSLLEVVSGLMLLQIPRGHDPHALLCWQRVEQGTPRDPPLSGGYRFYHLWLIFLAALVALLPPGFVKSQVPALGGFGLNCSVADLGAASAAVSWARLYPGVIKWGSSAGWVGDGPAQKAPALGRKERVCGRSRWVRELSPVLAAAVKRCLRFQREFEVLAGFRPFLWGHLGRAGGSHSDGIHHVRRKELGSTPALVSAAARSPPPRLGVLSSPRGVGACSGAGRVHCSSGGVLFPFC